MFTAVASVAISAEASEPEWMRGLDAALKKRRVSTHEGSCLSLYQKLSPTERPHQFALLRLLAESLTVEERLACLEREWGCIEPGNEGDMRRLKGQLLRNLALQQGKKPGPWMISLPQEMP